MVEGVLDSLMPSTLTIAPGCGFVLCGGVHYAVCVGGMAERPNALVLKTSDGQPSGGSNPPASAVAPGLCARGRFFLSFLRTPTSTQWKFNDPDFPEF